VATQVKLACPCTPRVAMTEKITINTRIASEKLAAEGIQLSPEQIAQLAKQGLFSGAIKDKSERWQIPESSIREFVQLKKRRKRITWGTIVAIITVLGLISIANDFFQLANNFFFTSRNPSTNSYIKILSITPERGLVLSKTDLQQGIPIEVKAEYRNSLSTDFKPGEVNPFIVLTVLKDINNDGTSNWAQLAKEEDVFFGTGEVVIKSVLLQDHVRDDKITLSIGLRFGIEGTNGSYASPDGNLIIEYHVTN
jgi:hypothetical protein